MTVRCVWEHNRGDTLLHAVDFPGACTRGECLEVALRKMPREMGDYLRWMGETVPDTIRAEIVEEKVSALQIRDADSDALFSAERRSLTEEEYVALKSLALKSAQDFLTLYRSVPDKGAPLAPFRTTFYGQAPHTAEDMYRHTQSVNAYYFAEINVEADNKGDILLCRKRGFDALETKPDFLQGAVCEGSYGEDWSLRKVLRRFIWHDRIHAKAMYRRAALLFGEGRVENPYGFRG